MRNISKRAAIELSIGTIVIVVLAMSMLVLGLILVKNIMGGAIDVADITNTQVRSQIVGLFSDSGSNFVIQLGADNTARLKSGGDAGNINIGAQPKSGGAVTGLGDLKFKIEVSNLANDCGINGVTDLQSWFQYTFNTFYEFDKLESNTLFTTIKTQIPDGTITCRQKFKITVVDTRTTPESVVGINSFFVEVIKKGIF